MSRVFDELKQRRPVLWINNAKRPATEALSGLLATRAQMEDAADRLDRAAPLFEALFPDGGTDRGIIESGLVAVDQLRAALGFSAVDGAFYLKADHALPIAGSVKARGGIYEVLLRAEEVAIRHGLIAEGDDLLKLAGDDCRRVFADYTFSVGSTGNLGLSIGIMASALGFKCTVHMSSDAKDWKKERLRQRGVTVVEHPGDFGSAVLSGRRQSEADPKGIFIDDENSLPLFLGYSVAALRLQRQLAVKGIAVDSDHPLFVYIPCGVGGAPGGICFGLKQVFGDAVHCFFAEPVASPCMLYRLATGVPHSKVYDLGLDNKTDADGLAVAEASELVAAVMEPLLSGAFTVEDDTMYRHVHALASSEGIRIEPSAAAGFSGPGFILGTGAGRAYLDAHGLQDKAARITHVLWTTGGSFVPAEELERFIARGRELAPSTITPGDAPVRRS